PPELAPPEPAPPQPAPPQPAPPQPAPPQPAPPKPAPPKPAPPKPAPPKPEPPQASSSKPRVPSLAERLRTAKVQGSAVPARRPPARAESSSNIRSRLLHNVSKSVSVPRNSPSNGSPSGSVMTLAEREAVNYADQVVNPRLAPIWDEVGPSRGDLDEAQSSTVEIVFTVLANGRITLPRISRRSSSAAMNQAAETLLQRIQGLHLPSLAESGIKSAKLSIRITLNAQAAQG
ncbi:MAG: TonB C-terminal domain-containing protein, partial [Oligosphaeraceae bacterium]|nr:TonB C-terminal domain-containing protein [Oligosphaeraceae bacterium]